VTLSRPSSTDTEITYLVEGTSTSSPGDRTLTPATVTILAEAATATIDVEATNDADLEPTETVIVTLQGVVGDPPAISVSPTAKTATVNIVDNEIGVTITRTKDGASRRALANYRDRPRAGLARWISRSPTRSRARRTQGRLR